MRTYYDTLSIEENICPPGCKACSEACAAAKRERGEDGCGIRELHIDGGRRAPRVHVQPVLRAGLPRCVPDRGAREVG